MNKFLIISYLFCTFSINAQNVKVEYNFKFIDSNEDYSSELFLENDKSLFLINETNLDSDLKENYNENGDYIIIRKDKKYLNRRIIKNFSTDTLLFYTTLKKTKKEYTIIKEKIEKLKWKLSNDSIKKVIDYVCKKATVSFRGKNYEVWYAPEIQFSDGPWKFWGLPGLILEVKSTDNSFSIVATSLKNNFSYHIETQILNDTISWNDYTNLVKEQLENEKKFFETSVSTQIEGAVLFATFKHSEPDLEIILE